jgi:DNA-binding transcriptional regulator LsrR (DeoR family)
VLTMEQWVTIRTFKGKNPKLGTRQIAELLGVSRNTVKRALRSEKEPEYVRTETVNPEIAPFSEFIFEELFVKRLRGSRVLKDIQSKQQVPHAGSLRPAPSSSSSLTPLALACNARGLMLTRPNPRGRRNTPV